MGRKVYFPFAIVTLIQFIGNIFFSYQFINIQSKTFQDWVELVTPLLSLFGVEEGDFVAHKRYLALFAGGLLPIISLSFLHMLVKFTEEERAKQQKIAEDEYKKMIDDKIIEDEIQKRHLIPQENITPTTIDASDMIGEISKVRLADEDLERLENILSNKQSLSESIEENLVNQDEPIENNVEQSVENDNTEESNKIIEEEVEQNIEQVIEPESTEETYDFSNEEGETYVSENYEENIEEQIRNNEEVEKFIEDNINDESEIQENNSVVQEEVITPEQEVNNVSEIDDSKKKILLKKAKLHYDSLKSRGNSFIQFGNQRTSLGGF
jgi:hypothetical protein